ncbi:MAG: FAD-dependent oxidoreductase [Chromatiaceae bacterium]
MRIAIVGSGIAGLTAAHHLHQQHQITLFEASGHVGGHVHTHDVELGGAEYRIDTGFIVFNRRTYPHFTALLAELGVASQKSDMSFSVSCGASGLEYNGTSLNALFAQRENLLRPGFWGMPPVARRRPRDFARRLPRRESVRAPVPRLLHPAHGGRHLVDGSAGDARFPRPVLRAFPSQPRPLVGDRPARVAGGARRLQGLCRVAGRALPGPDQAA